MGEFKVGAIIAYLIVQISLIVLACDMISKPSDLQMFGGLGIIAYVTLGNTYLIRQTWFKKIFKGE